MEIKPYFDGLDAAQRQQFAERLGTSVAYLSQLAHGHRRASPDMARRLVKESDGELTLAGIRPDIWGDIAAA